MITTILFSDTALHLLENAGTPLAPIPGINYVVLQTRSFTPLLVASMHRNDGAEKMELKKGSRMTA